MSRLSEHPASPDVECEYEPHDHRASAPGMHGSISVEHVNDLLQQRQRKSKWRFGFSLPKTNTTEELHAADPTDVGFYGAHGHLRKTLLDYNYHAHYKKERQWLHDAIIEDALLKDTDDDNRSVSETEDDRSSAATEKSTELQVVEPVAEAEAVPIPELHSYPTCTSLWLILAVGVHGVGKHYVIQDLIATNKLRLLSLVCIDTDDIRTYLPEYTTFLRECPDKLSELTRKEAGYIAETLTLATLRAGRNAIFFCCAKNCDWYMNKFLPMLCLQYPGLKVGMIHVTANRDAVLARSRKVAREAGRPMVEADVVENLDGVVPGTVSRLKPVVDYSCTIRNDGDELELLDDGGDWQIFVDTFDQRNANQSPHLSCRDPIRRRSSLMQRGFSAHISSEENHKSDDMKFYGPFANIRETLDYSYHKNYTFERQRFQDAVIREFLDEAVLKNQNGEVCTTPTMPWIVFTAGAFGSGKGYTLKKLVENGRFPLVAFVRVDPDVIRRYLPEFNLYVQQNPERAGEYTNKEAGYIAEILTLAGLCLGRNVIVDGSLRRSNWYRDYFARLRQEFPTLRIAIIHVTAPRESVFQRAAERAIHTKRIIPYDLLVETLEQVPRSVSELAPLADYHVELSNVTGTGDIELVTPGETWESFTAQWNQTCAWVPKRQKLLLERSKRIERKIVGAAEN